jgi:hypothetical protein
MDNVLFIVLGAVSSFLFGINVCILDFKTFRGKNKWRALLGLVISLAIVYVGSTAAVWEYPWAFGFGAIIVVAVLILLLTRFGLEYYWQRKKEQDYANMCPDGAWDDTTTFPCFLSVYHGILYLFIDCHSSVWRS